ncbi:MAG: hypothetical protein ACD_24C00454G0004 [uncultured bacterium]|nr:MAG: hypothetical protein ACD_24C00454G0004 [uncultured bacterium]KKR16216.1 MAG: hypothetical protein UT44_C0017G0008 [Candidatus Levybacteria bacterium GW2011_GWA1_39_32]KKR50984.1 MAG: hypothetical protein UT87_C0009G0009 [Candidatus Levybacteria bacterium GW2011_GWC1_40_19]KKR72838.1 MAG: hypothetical protein UU15_C0025G0007 [Candidatus Levybacteria bacterium GW2011_GWC2_40_7]KKR95121.1 MAG: hypothetical protein UU45_C0004G0024 [Candidatus Levybacteria bacterium GW2011_GWA2_41_15]KKS011
MDRRFEISGTPIIGHTVSEREFVRGEFERSRRSKAIMSGTATRSEIARASAELAQKANGKGGR